MSDYKRFTEKRNGKNVIPLRNAVCGIELPHWSIDKQSDIQSFLSGDAVDRLAELEDKIEQGTLIELPCKAGDKFWCINETKYGAPFVMDMTVDYFKIINGVFYMGHFNCFRIVAWQKSELFNTREEAEKRLKELQNISL